ncbi:MAG TPA: hypothetical protein VE963_08355, partial [Reyranella sp.]|nr:hypothetical protein [Reyranella sp.]
MKRLALALALLGAMTSEAAAQGGPRVEPPAGGLIGPTLGGSVDSSLPPSVPAQTGTPDLVVDLSVPRVSITSAFQGESI